MNYLNDKKEASADESAKEIEFAENFTNAAREMYSTGNANSGRVGCFSSEAIVKMTNSAKLPDETVMNHLFECSECFRDYRQALQSAKNPVAAEAKSGWRNLFNLKPLRIGLVGAVFVLLVGLMFFSFWIVRKNQPVELAKNIEISETSANNETIKPPDSTEKQNSLNSQTQSNQPEIDRKEDNAPAKKRQSSENLKPETSAAKSVNLFLSAGNVLRNAANSQDDGVENNKTVLPADKVNLNVELPRNFSNGLYRLKIVDAFGKVLLEQKTLFKNGILLSKNLNLRNLEGRANKLCLQKDDETPDCFDIKIAR